MKLGVDGKRRVIVVIIVLTIKEEILADVYRNNSKWRFESDSFRTNNAATTGKEKYANKLPSPFCGAAVCLRPLEQGLDAALLVVYWVIAVVVQHLICMSLLPIYGGVQSPVHLSVR
ncbi:hypothetical protein T265_00956 [Opisthorchis viverrini]|uniref:Uncharacterized protein n=1 Tax=Opisthorchis viverrini TaxID=6198 RepID=A0A075A011_OPIVI|nr:hypothetical protein T265_00956 [Opisthorchis viverrini]KER33053.1 hypothetical protein T265_00956 [Opisthorchis viverrini]